MATSLRLQAECGYNPAAVGADRRSGADGGRVMNMQSAKPGPTRGRVSNKAAGDGIIAKRLRVISLLIVVLTGSMGLSVAWASEYKKAATQNYLVEPKPEVSLETATAIVRHRTGGRVLSANSSSRGAEVGYQVRVLIDERQVQTWFVDRKGRALNE
jgi:hypothetical protein